MSSGAGSRVMAVADYDSFEMLAAAIGSVAMVWFLFSSNWVPALIVLAAAAVLIRRGRMSQTALMAGLLTGVFVFPLFLFLAFLGAIMGVGGVP